MIGALQCKKCSEIIKLERSSKTNLNHQVIIFFFGNELRNIITNHKTYKRVSRQKKKHKQQ